MAKKLAIMESNGEDIMDNPLNSKAFLRKDKNLTL
jgi:hypothetical protein